MARISTWAVALFLFSAFAWAQQTAQMPAPKLPASVLGPQLVVWSDLQKPKPTSPQPVPPPEHADQSQPQTGDSQAQAEPPSLQAFTGTIIKDGSRYLLRVSEGVSYQIDDQEKARNYEGKQVKVSGSLDSKTSILHVTSIELLS